MAKENPQASDENELEIGVEESEVERSDSSSSEEEESSDSESEIESSDSESEIESETVTGLKRCNEEEGTSVVRSKKSRVDDGEEEDDWFEKSVLIKAMTSFGTVNELLVRERWSMLPMETKKRLKDEWRVIEAEEMRIMRLKAKFVRDVASALASVVVP